MFIVNLFLPLFVSMALNCFWDSKSYFSSQKHISNVKSYFFSISTMLNVDLQIKLFPNRTQPFLDPFTSIFVYFYKVLSQPSAEQQMKVCNQVNHLMIGSHQIGEP